MARVVRFTFASPAFRAVSGEDGKKHSGHHGRALATWLVTELRGTGRTVEDAYAEDVGWIFVVPDPRRRLEALCTGVEQTRDRWHVVLQCEPGLLARLLGKDRSAEVLDEVRADVRRLLSERPDVRDVVEDELR